MQTASPSRATRRATRSTQTGRLLVASALAIVTLLLSTGSAEAASVLAQEWAPSKVSHFGDMTAWSRLDPRTGDYRLVIHDGQREHLPLIEPRSVPFDVDLGPNRFGDVVATYSRCEREPRMRDRPPALPGWATGKGCDVFLYSLKGGSARKETKISGASTNESSEFLPSAWRARVAFSRVYERRDGRRGTLPYLYVRALEDPARSERQPGGSRGLSDLPGPTALDLYGRRLGFGWAYQRDTGRQRDEIRLDTLDAGHRLVAWVQDSARTDFAQLTPSMDRGDIFWGTDCQGPLCGHEPQSAFVSRAPIERGSQNGGIAFLDGDRRLVSIARDEGRAALIDAAGYSTSDGQLRCRSEEDPQLSTTPGCRVVLRDDLKYGPPRG